MQVHPRVLSFTMKSSNKGKHYLTRIPRTKALLVLLNVGRMRRNVELKTLNTGVGHNVEVGVFNRRVGKRCNQIPYHNCASHQFIKSIHDDCIVFEVLTGKKWTTYLESFNRNAVNYCGVNERQVWKVSSYSKDTVITWQMNNPTSKPFALQGKHRAQSLTYLRWYFPNDLITLTGRVTAKGWDREKT